MKARERREHFTSQMIDSPVHSSSSDEFVAFLNAELDSASNVSSTREKFGEEVEDDENKEYEETELYGRNKRQKVDALEFAGDKHEFIDHQGLGQNPDTSFALDVCTHPGAIGGMCIKCGRKIEDDTSVSLGYIHKNLTLTNDEIARLREKDLKNLLHLKKLYLVLDLDHTLLHSTRLSDLSVEEQYLKDQGETLPDSLRGSLFRFDQIQLMTKLRPFVHSFLKEASSLFEMYIYTMGERSYALKMAKLLDPRDVYFHSRVIAQGDSTQKHQKDLDVVMGKDSAVLILDDTEAVWSKHKENLILMERYHFFASSSRQFGFENRSLSELKSDENEMGGTLSSVLSVLQRIHSVFFNLEPKQNLWGRDIRQVLKTVRKEVLAGCKIVFSRVFPTNFQAEKHHLWKMAEQLGAKCSKECDLSVTHVVSLVAGTEKSLWAVRERKFLVNPEWIKAANYRWRKPPEEDFPVSM